MRRLIALVAVAGLIAVGFVAPVGPAQAKVPGPNGRIAFRVVQDDNTVTYTVNPDGSHMQQLFPGFSEGPRWSPDGSEVSVLAACTDGEENCAATIVDPDTGTFRQFKFPDPTLETNCSGWSPDGTRLSCGSFGLTDPSRNGIYTIRADDGRDLRRMTSNPGGEDSPGDYSPNGKRLVFARFDQNEDPVGLFVVKTNGTHLRRITPPGTLLVNSAGDWSPQGNAIVFSRRVTADRRTSLWVVHSNGSGLHEIDVQGQPGCGGPISDPTSRGCLEPRWSPDGTKIVFVLFTVTGENIYTVNVDGSDLTQVTHGGEDDNPDWGTHPLAG